MAAGTAHAVQRPGEASIDLCSCRGIEASRTFAETEWRRDSFKSVYRDGYFAHLIDVPDQQSGVELGRHLLKDPTTEYFRIVEVMRDYGMYDRAERRSIIRRWRGTPNGVGPANAIPRDFSV